MTSGPQHPPAQSRNPSLGARLAVLGAVGALACALAAFLGWMLSGPAGVMAAIVAAAACVAGAELALLAGHWLRGPSAALYGLLLGSGLRMAVPLATALVIRVRGGALADAGALYYLGAFYLVTLATETALSIAKTGSRKGCATASWCSDSQLRELRRGQ